VRKKIEGLVESKAWWNPRLGGIQGLVESKAWGNPRLGGIQDLAEGVSAALRKFQLIINSLVELFLQVYKYVYVAPLLETASLSQRQSVRQTHNHYNVKQE
jgi:hypothetical protein